MLVVVWWIVFVCFSVGCFWLEFVFVCVGWVVYKRVCCSFLLMIGVMVWCDVGMII